MNVAPGDEFVRVILIDKEGKLLMQQRSLNKKQWPGKWEFAGGKKEEGESLHQAAIRELFEEIGLSRKMNELTYFHSAVLPPEICGRAIFVAWFYTQYLGEVLNIQQREVAKVNWFDMEELCTELKRRPGEFLPGIMLFIDKFKEVLNENTAK